MTGVTRALIGPRQPPRSADPLRVLNGGVASLDRLRGQGPPAPAGTLLELKEKYAAECRSYYALAALSRRRILDDEMRDRSRSILFPLRSLLEKRILADMAASQDRTPFLEAAASRSFFGVSAKQGVSIRYALASCVPTAQCGARCYAHDGRDRELHIVFRAALNFFLGTVYETGTSEERRAVMLALDKSIEYGIEAAVSESQRALTEGYEREPRIRFSHVGEMAATPDFTNELAREIRRRNDTLACVIYTRHPWAGRLDPSVLRVNFTVEGERDSRWSRVPAFARVVSSAWDGEVTPLAAVNFLEHHVEKGAVARGPGNVCPVSLDHARVRSCDEARCDACFVPIEPSPHGG